ncbi:hypothetical protein N0V83_006389 [Neocucurbitaria cava]|uniref:Uncharacterized protein n=1 Tax=Neocucurbitaria cava TaxID=798079 RepID=A0A9W8Y7F2_9PLEO|nr:hypothetical protein N0V83_006389 [Neocucurbitaria cava]
MSASFAPSRQPRGRDWESWIQDDSDRLREDTIEPWRRGVITPSAVRRAETESRRGSRLYRIVPSLSLSKVQTIATSPRELANSHQSGSSTPRGSPSLTTSPLRKTTSNRPPATNREDRPKSMSDYEYAMYQFLKQNPQFDPILRQPPPTSQNAAPGPSSSLQPPAQDDEIPYAGSPTNAEDDEPVADGIPTHLKEKDAFRTQAGFMLLRTILLRCEVQLSIVRELERKPWAQEASKPPYYYYSKIRHFAYRAREIAEFLQSRDLQARCEYWAGWGCGGTRDWYAASEHFAMAIKLDVENDTNPNGRKNVRGLRANEKEDVGFLLESVRKRHERLLRNTEDLRRAAEYEAKITGKKVEDCIDWDGLDSPTWLPERDRVVRIARAEARSERAGRSGDEQRKEVEEDIRTLTRRTFSKEERYYVLCGDAQTRKHQQKLRQTLQRNNSTNPSKPSKPRPSNARRPRASRNQTDATASTSRSSNAHFNSISTTTSSQPTPPAPPPLNLREELSGWQSRTPTPTPLRGTFPLSTSASAAASPFSHLPPTQGLKKRRNLAAALAPIRMEGIRNDGRGLGEAVHGGNDNDDELVSNPSPVPIDKVEKGKGKQKGKGKSRAGERDERESDEDHDGDDSDGGRVRESLLTIPSPHPHYDSQIRGCRSAPLFETIRGDANTPLPPLGFTSSGARSPCTPVANLGRGRSKAARGGLGKRPVPEGWKNRAFTVGAGIPQANLGDLGDRVVGLGLGLNVGGRGVEI